MRYVLVIATVLAGCSGSEDAAPALVGTWSVTSPDACLLGVTFQKDEAYEMDRVCSLTGGGYGVQADIGMYSVKGARITFVPTRTSCPASGATMFSSSYSFTPGGKLRLLDDEGSLLVLDRQKAADEGASGVVAAFGCWKDQKFTRGALQDL